MTGDPPSQTRSFVVTVTGKRNPYPQAGRAILENGYLAIYLPDLGRYQAEYGFVRIAMLMGGPVPVRTPDGE